MLSDLHVLVFGLFTSVKIDNVLPTM